MISPVATSLSFIVAGLACCFSHAAAAQSQATPNVIADNDSVWIDGTAFTITAGKAKAGASSLIKALGARELGPGAIVFRSGEQLYIVDAPLLLPDTSASTGQSVLVSADKKQANRVRIEYLPPKNPEHQQLYDMLKAHAALETAQKLFSPIRLPVELTIKTVGCDGMVNAWYAVEESRPTLSVCYEYLQAILQHTPGTTSAGITRDDALLGQFLFVVAHEMGHALFELFGIPVFGREEDAADQVATYFLLQLGKDRVHGLVGGAAHAYAGYMKDYKENPKVAIPLEAFSSNHGSPEERFYNLLCIAYGASPALFADVVEEGHLPKTRAPSCKYEYKTLTYAVQHEISPHIDRQMADSIWDLKWISSATSAASPATHQIERSE